MSADLESIVELPPWGPSGGAFVEDGGQGIHIHFFITPRAGKLLWRHVLRRSIDIRGRQEGLCRVLQQYHDTFGITMTSPACYRVAVVVGSRKSPLPLTKWNRLKSSRTPHGDAQMKRTDLDSGDAEVCNLHAAVGIKQDVLRFQVPMDDAWVHVRQTLSHIMGNLRTEATDQIALSPQIITYGP